MVSAGIAVAVLLMGLVATSQLWTEYVWFDQMGYASVWRTQLTTRVALFLVGGLVAAAVVWSSVAVARRARSTVIRKARRGAPIDVQEQYESLERVAAVALPTVVGILAGAAVSSKWQAVLAFQHQTPFGVKDPQFGLDASFYVFTLPVLTMVVGYLLAVLVIAALGAAFVHFMRGAMTGIGRVAMLEKTARTQLGILGALVMIVIGLRYWLERYSLVLKDEGRFAGASYTDINAVLPARGILAGIALVVAGLFIAVLFRPDWRMPVVGVGLMTIAAIVVGGIYPGVVARFQVRPNEQQLETPFIQRNIAATLYAFGLDDIEVTPYAASTDADAQALRDDADTTASIRLLDPNIVSPAFQQLQQNKQYYHFAKKLAVDRYMIDGTLQDTVIAVRELDLAGLSEENRSWINDHTVFTHGFGVVAAYGNRTNADGQPTFFEGGIPSSGALGDYEPRIYFGSTLPSYSIVGAPEGSPPLELDYPDDSVNGQVNTTYKGDGGPSIGSGFAKIMYAIKFGEDQILFSGSVTPESQILYYRDPVERVAKVAPYLELDGNTYPAVVDGRVVWVVDGYTTSPNFPYADNLSVGIFADPGATDTSLDRMVDVRYIRNSVKATVDAYDGAVTLYAWDTEDPILQTWLKVYPGTVKSIEDISAEQMSHFRYPDGLFQIQRFQLASYHVTDAASFYSGQDFWRNPYDPTVVEKVNQPPYYLTLQMPGQDEPVFSLTSTFIPGGNSDRNVLTGFLAVNSEPGSTAGVVHPDYGKLRLLELPRDSTVPGPGQVQNAFNSDPEAQNILNLLRQGETTVLLGNLLTLPVGEGLLYVQPVYVQSSKGTQFPLLQKVLVAFGDEVGFADTLAGALDQVFGAGAAPVIPGTDDPDTPEVPGSTDAAAKLKAALEDAESAIAAGQAALAAGDFAAYGDAQAALKTAIAKAIAAEAELSGDAPDDTAPAVTPTPSPSPTPSSTAAPDELIG